MRPTGPNAARPVAPGHVWTPDAIFVAEGDSLISGSESVVSWPDQVALDRTKILNVGTGGLRMCTSIRGRVQTNVIARFEAGKVNVALCQGGVNDIKAGGGTVYTALDIYNAHRDWGLAVKAAGGHSIGLTIEKFANSVEQEQMHVDTDALLVGNADGAFDLVIDISGLAGDHHDGIYFGPDHLHLTTFGQSTRRDYIQPIVQSFINSLL